MDDQFINPGQNNQPIISPDNNQPQPENNPTGSSQSTETNTSTNFNPNYTNQNLSNSQPVTSQPQSNYVNQSGQVGGGGSKKSNSWLIIGIITIVVIVLAVAAYFIFYQHNKKHTPIYSSSNSGLSSSSNQLSNYGGDTFLPQPKLLPFQPIYKNSCSTSESSSYLNSHCLNSGIFSFYQIGLTANNNPIIVAYNPTSVMSPSELFYAVFVKKSNGTYDLVKQYNQSFYSSYGLNINGQDTTPLQSDVKVDLSNPISALSLPSHVTLSGGYDLQKNSSIGSYFITGYHHYNLVFGNSASAPNNLNLIGQSNGYQYFSHYNQLEGSIETNTFYGLLNNDFAALYQLKLPFTNNHNNPAVPSITWSNGQSNTAQYVSYLPDCNPNQNYYLTDGAVQSSDLTKIGQSSNGQNIYSLPASNALLTTIAKNSKTKVSASQLQANHGVFLVKNSINQYVIYLQPQYENSTQC